MLCLITYAGERRGGRDERETKEEMDGMRRGREMKLYRAKRKLMRS